MRTPSQHIFTTKITRSDGEKRHVMSSQPLSDSSIRINAPGNSGSVFLLIGLCLQNNRVVDNNTLARLINRIIYYRGMVPDVWENILTFSFGEQQESLSRYIVAIRKPIFFPQITTNPSDIVDAAIRGEEDVVLNILKADPSYLLKTAKIKNSVGVDFKVTPLQAAIIATDVQLIEKMEVHFARLPNGDVEMQEQIFQIYKKSLRVYLDKQEEKITRMTELKKSGTAINEAELTEAQTRRDAYLTAVRNTDINVIFKAHNQAQEHNTFDFDPYVNAILSAPDAELDAVMELINATTPEETATVISRYLVAPKESDVARAKSFDELTLVEKLNRFREEFVKHTQQEIIFNPNHILTGSRRNEKTWDAVDAGRITDPDYKKRSIIFSQLIGWAQRNAHEPVKQDMRQGTWYLIEENEPRTRQSRFNEYRNGIVRRNSLVDVSLVDSHVVDGVGYKFALAACACVRRVAPAIGGSGPSSPFQNLCRAKTASFQNLLRSPRQHLASVGV